MATPIGTPPALKEPSPPQMEEAANERPAAALPLWRR